LHQGLFEELLEHAQQSDTFQGNLLTGLFEIKKSE